MYQPQLEIAHKIASEISSLQALNADFKSVVVAISGGVDSSVSAKLLTEAGFNVRGVYANCWGDLSQYKCESPGELEAIKTATEIGVPIKVLDLTRQYSEYVFQDFIRDYSDGRTPNPDVLCNSHIKFGVIRDLECVNGDLFATGHYSKLYNQADSHGDSYKYIGMPADLKKDQSYYLCDLIDNEVLNSICFPLNNLLKSEVRNIAKYFGLSSYDKKDSQGICFIGDVKLRNFIAEYLKPKKGNVYDKDMNLIGSHNGAHFFTIGQRHGFDIYKYTGSAMYVIGKNTKENYIVVGPKNSCFFDSISISNIKFAPGYNFENISLATNVGARVRSLGQIIAVNTISGSQNRLIIKTHSSVFAPASGQYMALYKDNYIIASGVIS